MYYYLEAAATDAAAASGKVNAITTLVMLAAMIAVFYFFMYRPQKKQEKQIAEMRDSLAVGDEVVTIGGIIGTVLIIKDDKIMIETGNDRTKLTILRSSVKTVLKDEDEAPAK